MTRNFHNLKVKELIKETQNTVSILFSIPENLKEQFQYKSGQYLTIKKIINNEEVRRSYSISSCPTLDADIKVSSKMLEGGKMSTYFYKELGVGDELEVMPPDGSFILKRHDQPLILFAAGSGITPVISILKDALVNGSQQVHLYYGNRSEEEIIFKTELKALREKYSNRLLVQHFLSSNGERLDADRTKAIVAGLSIDASVANYFICGPEGMIQAVKAGLEDSGISKVNINIEYFASPKAEKKESVVAASGNVNDVTLIIDGEEHKTTLTNGESILDAANRIGIDPPFSCQSGVCTTCKGKVMAGSVEMENNFGLGEDEVEEGFILTCISTPTSAGVKVSWDED
jgi:ring-1,2-phenylacetyl-CoA epoxidase subunit PaaE